MSALLTLALLVTAGGTELEDERAQVHERLEAEKAAFEALGAQRKGLLRLTLLDTLERLARESADRAGRLEKALRRVAKQAAEAQQHLEQAQHALREQERRLAPRLVTLYRLQRRDALGALLASSDFATLVKRQRALQTLVNADLAALDELALLSAWAQGRAHRSAAGGDRAALPAGAPGRAGRGASALGSVQRNCWVQSRLSRGEWAAWSRQARDLGKRAGDDGGRAGSSPTAQQAGFRARKGQLPFPTTGIVEVGFGQLNPRFNTVTVQKGIDVRAAAGARWSRWARARWSTRAGSRATARWSSSTTAVATIR